MKKNVFFYSLLTASLFFSATAFSAKASAKALSSSADAENAALSKVPGAIVLETDKDTEDGVQVYEVDLRKGKKDYSLVYQTSNGKLIEYEWEYPDELLSSSGTALSKKQIKAKAKKKVKKAKISSIYKDYDDGITEYKVRMTKNKKYFTLVYTNTGKLIEYGWKTM